MSIAVVHPSSPKMRSAVLAIFIAFAVFFLAYVDLYMVVDEHAFRPVSRAFWDTFNLSYIAFFAVVIAVLSGELRASSRSWVSCRSACHSIAYLQENAQEI